MRNGGSLEGVNCRIKPLAFDVLGSRCPYYQLFLVTGYPPSLNLWLCSSTAEVVVSLLVRSFVSTTEHRNTFRLVNWNQRHEEQRRCDKFRRCDADVSRINQIILTEAPSTLDGTRRQKNTWITVFGHFGIPGSQPNFNQIETFYKQLSINILKETRPSSNGKKWKWIRPNIMPDYKFCIVDLSGIRCEANIFTQFCFLITTLLIEISMEKNQAGSFGSTWFWLH